MKNPLHVFGRLLNRLLRFRGTQGNNEKPPGASVTGTDISSAVAASKMYPGWLINALVVLAVVGAGLYLWLRVRTPFLDTAGPNIHVQSPTESPVGSREVEVRLRVTDRKVKEVWIDGNPASPMPGDIYTAKVQLRNEGSNRFEAVAKDWRGNETSLLLTVVRDTKGPTLRKLLPSPGTLVNEPWIEVQLEVVDETGEPFVAIEGTAAAAHGDGAYSRRVSLPREGRNSIDILLRDALGNEGKQELTVIRDTTPPRFADLAPADGSRTNGSTIMVRVRVEDEADGLGAVMIGGRSADCVSEGMFDAEVPLEHEGKNTIELLASDRAKNNTRRELTVYRDSTPPAVEISGPEETAALLEGGGEMDLSGKVADASPPVTVEVNGKMAKVDGETWRIRVPVSLKSPTVSVEAIDSLGNRTSTPTVREFHAAVKGFTYAGRNPQGLPEYVHDKTKIRFVLLSGGEFKMGSPSREVGRSPDEGPVHLVILRPFLIAKFEVSASQWREVMGEDGPFRFSKVSKDKEFPITSVTWEEVIEFCRKTGLELPTEAQWEYSCRAGTPAQFAFGDLLACRALSNCDGRLGDVVPVDSLTPNRFGLFNMHGNVSEWCLDVYGAHSYERPYASDGDVACNGPKSLFGRRVVRGGSFADSALRCRSATRESRTTMFKARERTIGFRPVFSLGR